MGSFWQAAAALTREALAIAVKWGSSAALTAHRVPMAMPADESGRIEEALMRILQQSDDVHPEPEDYELHRLADRIRKETEAWNRNNVTRTQAYWNLYRDFPELHWALLAHMVSRNGGWYMTDLRGEWLPRLLDPGTAKLHFDLLETSNALIFRDAYPQLRLYAESRKRGMPLFHLLPRLGASVFMQPFWERFWAARNPVPLTVALIINEQHVIQGPVVEHPRFRNHLASPMIRAQPLLQMTQIVFPVFPAGFKPASRPVPLAGKILESFSSLEERIGFGKSLYALLFGCPRVLAGVQAFAERTPHTGSRADYWPQRFRAHYENGGSCPKGKLPAEERWHSPPLEKAWPDQPLPDFPASDWFRDIAVLKYLTAPRSPRIVDMTQAHLQCMRRLQAAEALPLPEL